VREGGLVRVRGNVDGTVVGPQSGATAVHSYEAAWTYSITLDVTDTAGLSSSATAQVTATAAIVWT